MKVYLLILAYLLFACSNSTTKIPANILSKTEFENILKEIHLAEATFELNKTANIKNAKNELANAYFDLYKKHQISESDFKEAFNYYSENYEKLDQVYTNLLNQLTKERSQLDQQ